MGLVAMLICTSEQCVITRTPTHQCYNLPPCWTVCHQDRVRVQGRHDGLQVQGALPSSRHFQAQHSEAAFKDLAELLYSCLVGALGQPCA